MDDGTAVMLLAFGRHGSAFPPERELLHVDADGSYVLWRSFGAAAVGRFRGTVPDLDGLEQQVDAARGAPAPGPPAVEPDASVEVVALRDGEEVELAADGSVGGPWGALVATCRRLLDVLTESPSAAVVASLPDAATLRLAHAGDEVLPVELGSLAVEVTRWHEGLQVGWSTTHPSGLGHVDAGPGWALDVALDPAATAGPGQLVVTATFVANDGGVYVPVVATARRP